jgi:hypothetical protein
MRRLSMACLTGLKGVTTQEWKAELFRQDIPVISRRQYVRHGRSSNRRASTLGVSLKTGGIAGVSLSDVFIVRATR